MRSVTLRELASHYDGSQSRKRYAIADILPLEGVTMLYGHSETGKTSIATRTSIAIAVGTCWAGRMFIKSLDILDAAEAAVYLRSSPRTLAKLRCYGGGPSFIRQSARKVLYRHSDLDAWLGEHASNNRGP